MSRKTIISEYVEEILPDITDAEAGWVLRAVIAMNKGEDPGDPPPGLRVAWKGIRREQALLIEAYDRKCATARRSVNARWDAERIRTYTNVSKNIRTYENVSPRMLKEREEEREEEKKKEIPEEPKTEVTVVPVDVAEDEAEEPKTKPKSPPEERQVAPARESEAQPPPPNPAFAAKPVTSAFGLRPSGFIPNPLDPDGTQPPRPEQFADPVDYALATTGEPNTKKARNCYGGLLRDLGPDAFNAVVETFAAELRAGEAVRSPGAALNARLAIARSRAFLAGDPPL